MRNGSMILWTSLFAMFLAQFLKVFFYFLREKRMNFRHMVESGGMPSSHSSLVVCMATGVGIVEGTDSAIFAVAVIFAMVVMYDAAGVRQAAGKQARVLNKILDDWEQSQALVISEERLKELLGHTPRQVLAGAFLGMLVAGAFLG
jgi:acid phosphatase family membrane protein YuiD